MLNRIPNRVLENVRESSPEKELGPAKASSSWRRHLAGRFATCLTHGIRRRDAGATRSGKRKFPASLAWSRCAILERLPQAFLLLPALVVLASLPALAQDAAATLTTPEPAATPTPKPAPWGVPEGRPFFPENWVRGYVGFDVAPPHNEPDLGRCTQSHAIIVAAGGANSPCDAYARYLLSGYLEVQPFGRTFARHVFVFFTPTFSFGNNVPQFKYTASMAGIAFERAVGFGVELPKNFEFRVTQHQVDWLGKYKNNVGGPAGLDLGTAGPYGLYTTIGARWYFGGYGRSHEGR